MSLSTAEALEDATQPTQHHRPTDWLTIARSLADDFRTHAIDRDREKIKPFQQLRTLRASGLLSLFYPKEHGGGGGSIHDAAWSVLEIGRADGSLGALLAFHYYNSAVPLFLDFEGDNAAILRRSTEQRWLWGNVTQYVNRDFFAEPHPDGGYTINGTKKWNTGAPLADVTTVLAIHTGLDRYIYSVVPTSREGITFHGDWDPIGLRGADSSTVTFKNVRVHPDEVIPWRHEGVQDKPIPFWTTFGAVYYSAVYLGSIQGALDTAQDYARNRKRQVHAKNAPPTHADPLVQAQFGEAWIKLQAGLGYFDRVIAELQEAWDRRRNITEEERNEIAVKTLALRYYTARLALELTPQTFEFGGGTMTGDAEGFDRFWRNVRTLASHDPLVHSVRTVGDYALNGTLTRFGSHFPKPTPEERKDETK
ncbi:acyl-CoA dehydrogenase family protein [Granulicella sibirica]|uniref:Dibenzothiophene monooxygenase n=1 Tax=Granulicella sibirica TaxID=2479048 RepID=A0A4Q0T332_9BACT|nr:acyl-CoA dehydrogenase family protein [Granulicella sibirica]RXH57993.1 Acyl-CoA dehydrogenase [Granulicella sibirica]